MIDMINLENDEYFINQVASVDQGFNSCVANNLQDRFQDINVILDTQKV